MQRAVHAVRHESFGPLTNDLSPLLRYESAPDDAQIPISEPPERADLVYANSVEELDYVLTYAERRLYAKPKARIVRSLVRHEAEHAAGFAAGHDGQELFSMHIAHEWETRRTYVSSAHCHPPVGELSKIAFASAALRPHDFSYEDRLIMYALGYRSAAELDERIVTFNALRGAHLLRPSRRGKVRDWLTRDERFTD